MYQPLIKFHPYPAIITQVLLIFDCIEDRMRLGHAKLSKLLFAWHSTFAIFDCIEDRMRFGIAKLETAFPFVSALTFRYLCLRTLVESWEKHWI